MKAFSRIQRAGNIGIRVEARKDGGSLLAVIRRAERGTPLGEDSRRVRELLGLEEDVTEFEIVYGLIPRNRNEVAMLTRSMMEIMLQLGFRHRSAGRHAAGGRALPGQTASRQMHRPSRSFISIPANGSRRMPMPRCRTRGIGTGSMTTMSRASASFTFLMILFSLAETARVRLLPS